MDQTRQEPVPPSTVAGAGTSFHRSPYLWAFLAGIVTLTLIRPLLRSEPAPPPPLWQLPPFELTDSRGRPFGDTQLAGRVYIASFFFTRCASICPELTRAMSRLEQRYREAGIEGVHLVSITVDPEHDTAERLREYGAAHGVDPDRWTLLTGDIEPIRSLVEHGFKTPLGKPMSVGEGWIDVAHSGKLVLVDGQGAVRGYYDSDEAGLDEIFHRSQHVLHDGR